jgi:hypothetical protein
VIDKLKSLKINQSNLPGQGALRGALPHFFLPTALTDSQGWRFRLRPFVCLTHRFRSRIDWDQFSTVFCGVCTAALLRFGPMIRGYKTGSKLCALSTRHANQTAWRPSGMAQLGKGSQAPRCIPSCRASRQMEPVAGSTPLGVRP